MVPRSKKERYYSDMTRTVLHGTPSDELKDMYSAVFDSQSAAINKIKAELQVRISTISYAMFWKKEDIRPQGQEHRIHEGFIHSTGTVSGLTFMKDQPQ